jgi:hypothetical protein
MGLRGLERQLAMEVCYQVVADVVDEYLRQSREAGRLLGPIQHLKMPILKAGFQPPGLHKAAQKLARRQPRQRAHLTRDFKYEIEPPAKDPDKPLKLPSAEELIDQIFSPYFYRGLRTHRLRGARSFPYSQPPSSQPIGEPQTSPSPIQAVPRCRA